MKKFSIYSNTCLFACTILLAGVAIGQDLGSSNKLFDVAKKSRGIGTAKKSPVKRRAMVSKAKAPSKATGTTASKNTAPVRSANTAANKTRPRKGGPGASKVDTSSSQTPDPGLPQGAAADELYENLIEEGNAARDDREYAKAESAYQRAKFVKPYDARAVYGLGNLFGDQRRWEDAESAYRSALQLEPDDATAHIALSFVLTQPIYAANLSDRYEEAESLARRAIKLSPSNSLAYDQLGVALELRGIISAETENAYRRSIQLDPAFAPAHAHLGRLLRRRGLAKESAAAYQDAIRFSTDVATMVLVAEVIQSEQQYSESEQLLRKALEIDPKNPAALLLLGRALTTQGNFTEAEIMLRRCLAVTPNGFVPNTLLGSLYARQGKFELAENALLQALRFVSPYEKRSLSLQFETVGDGYLKTGKPRNAERAYKRAVVLDGERESLSGKLAVAEHS